MIQRPARAFGHAPGPPGQALDMYDFPAEQSRESSTQIHVEFYAVGAQELSDSLSEMTAFGVPVGEHDDSARRSPEFVGQPRERRAVVDEYDPSIDAESSQGRTVPLPLHENDRSRFEGLPPQLGEELDERWPRIPGKVIVGHGAHVGWILADRGRWLDGPQPS
jgi:hypothetical protein